MTASNEQCAANSANTSRRKFLRTAGAAAGAAAFSPRIHALGQQAKGANGRIGIGFIGTGGRAQAHIDIVNRLKKEGTVQPVAVCDVYRPRLEAAGKKEGGAKTRIKALGELGFDTKRMSIRSFLVEEEIGAAVPKLSPIMKQPDQRKGDGRINAKLFNRPFNIATQIQYRPAFRGNFDLTSRSTDTVRFRNTLRLEGLWRPHDKVAVFAQGRLNWNIRETQRHSISVPRPGGGDPVEIGDDGLAALVSCGLKRLHAGPAVLIAADQIADVIACCRVAPLADLGFTPILHGGGDGDVHLGHTISFRFYTVSKIIKHCQFLIYQLDKLPFTAPPMLCFAAN